MIVLVSSDDTSVDSAENLGRDGVLVIGDVVVRDQFCTRGGKTVSFVRSVNLDAFDRSLWIWVGVNIQHTEEWQGSAKGQDPGRQGKAGRNLPSKMISISASVAFFS